MRLVSQTRPWRGALYLNESIPEYEAHDWLSTDLPAAPVEAGASQQVVVEAYFHASSMVPRCVLGGRFTPGGDRFEVRIGISDELRERQLESAFGRDYQLGLPIVFARAILQQFESKASPVDLPGGKLVICTAGIDPNETSEFAFARAGSLLLWSVAMCLRPGAPTLGEFETFTSQLTVDL